MKIRCIVIDDEPVALQKMQKYVEQIPYLQLVAACDSPTDAIKVCLLYTSPSPRD